MKEMAESNQTPESREREFRGIEGQDITSSGFILKPETTFKLASKINQEARSEKEKVKVEMYPTVRPRILAILRKLGLPIPPTVTPDLVRQWQTAYPDVEVSRVHLEFSYDHYETDFHRWTVGEDFTPIKDALKQRMFQIAWIGFFGPASSGRGITLAQELGVGVNVHANVLEGLAKEGKLEELKEKVAFVLAETERPYNSPHMQRLKPMGISSREFVSDPELVRKEIVEKYGLDGLVLAVDHMIQFGMDPVEKLERTADSVRAIHLAGTKGNTGAHSLFEIGDPQISRFLEAAAKKTYNGKVSVALDLNPLDIMAMPFEKQLDVIANTFKWIKSTQA